MCEYESAMTKSILLQQRDKASVMFEEDLFEASNEAESQISISSKWACQVSVCLMSRTAQTDTIIICCLQ